MTPRLPVPCDGERHWLYIQDDGSLRPDPRSHDFDLERSLVALGAKEPLCLCVTREWDDTRVRPPISIAIALLSKQVHPKVLLIGSLPFLREALAVYERAPLPGKKLPQRVRQTYDVIKGYVEGRASKDDVKHMKTVLSKAGHQLYDVRFRAHEKDRADRTDASGQKSYRINQADKALSVAFQIICAASDAPDAPVPTPTESLLVWQYEPGQDNWLYGIDSAINQVQLLQPLFTGPTRTVEEIDEEDLRFQHEAARILARAAEEYYEE